MEVEPAEPSLRSSVLRGIAWKAISQIFGQGFRIAVAIVLARLLTPSDYGLAAMVLVFSALVPILADLALGAALIQRKTLTEADRSTAFWAAAGVGVLMTAGGVALSWPLADFYGEPRVQPLFAALSLSFVVSALSTTQTALLHRDMDFRRLELRMMAATVTGGGLAIWLASAGFGPWAIVGQQLAVVAVSTLLLWVLSPWRPRLVFSLQALRGFAGFSGRVFGTRILFYLNRSSDNLLIGRFIGPAGLGAYAVAYNVMLSPIMRLAWPIQTVMFPAFSKIQDDAERMTSIWIRVNRAVGAVTIPAMLGLVVVAEEFVTVVLGSKWSEAVPVVQILAWVGLLQSLQSLNSSVLEARDRTGRLLWYSAVALVASLAAFAVGLRWGIVGVAAAYAVASTLVEPYYTYLTASSLGVPVRSLLAALRGAAEASAAMVAVVLGVKALLLGAGADPAVILAACVAAGVLAYLPLCAWRAPEVRRELEGLARRGAGTPPAQRQPVG